ncbi:DNA-directed RNA polymerase, mitochondrial isoform X1 [Hydra vulgaris]|nr:DNA-directed RNA polymerase, mitochondrial-like [Hydra vulgaris]
MQCMYYNEVDSNMIRSIFGFCKACNNLKIVFYRSQDWHCNYLSKSSVYRSRSGKRNVTNFSKTKSCSQQSVQEGNYDAESFWKSIEHDIEDEKTLELLKSRLYEKMEDVEDDDLEKIYENDVDQTENTLKKKKNVKITLTSKYAENNQLTHQAENNVLAECDIYIYLGEITQAFNLFNYHRRHGHKFDIEGYNKIIHGWAVHRDGWKNIKVLLQNIKSDGLLPNYQTYAGLLVACSNMDDKKKTKEVIKDMLEKGFHLNNLFKNTCLSKPQIIAILKAVNEVDPCYLDGIEEKIRFTKETVFQPTTDNVVNMIKEQINNELRGSVKIKSVDKTKLHSKKAIRRAEWYKQIIEQWKKDFILEIINASNTKGRKSFANDRLVTFTKIFTAEELADIIFDDIFPLLCAQPNGMDVSFLCRHLGRLLFERFCSKYKQKTGVVEKVEKIAQLYCTNDESLSVNSECPRQKWEKISDSLPYLSSEELLPTYWPSKLRTTLAGYLLNILKNVAKVDTSLFTRTKETSIESCVVHSHNQDGYKLIGIMKVHPLISRLWHSYLNQLGEISFEVNKLPMVMPPRPWVSLTSGAYLLLHSDFVRTVSGQYKLHELSKASKEGQLSRIFDSLNYLGNCGWKVNTKILDIMLEMFNNKGDMKLDIIGPIETMMQQYDYKEDMTAIDKKTNKRLKKKLHHELFALRMDLLYKLSISNHYRDKIFWIPNNLDFRGRAYPIAPHCSHIGSDAARGLLLFAKGKKLGENGLNWIKVHLVNVHGHLKKSSLKERIEYADNHLEEIMDSADKPLTGKQWWREGTDPWQTLVACIEITNALRSPDPSSYVTYAPVHMDGSCNGLQHYASLGQDSYGARQVNLTPADKPQDVYSEVALLVEKARQRDASKGDTLAKELDGKITRKVVKQTVMTVVYGVTFVGGRLQIEKQLKEMGVSNDIIFKASVYIVKEVFKSLQEMFTSARQIQDWLTNSASQIALAGHCVDWVTPMGLPVVQPYHKETTERFRTKIQTVCSSHKFDYTQIPHLTKQKGGFPPNFVHSLDSTHMMMTSLRCEQEKMTFASVHDSFWTHACDIDKLNEFCRQEFVHLHELPILEDLKNHFDRKFSGLPLRKAVHGSSVASFNPLPKPGTFDVRQVLNSTYFFS